MAYLHKHPHADPVTDVEGTRNSSGADEKGNKKHSHMCRSLLAGYETAPDVLLRLLCTV